jgi:AraC-like DNA-binding protein
MATLKKDKPRGILNAKELLPMVRHARYSPSEDLAPFVEHYWTVEWDLADATVVETLPHPSVHIVLEPGSSQLAGVATAKFSRLLQGTSRVFGVKFHPGGFHPFVRRPVSAYRDQTLALSAVLGSPVDALDQKVLIHEDHQASIGVMETALRALGPVPDPAAELAARIADRIATDRRLVKVEQITREFDIGLRKLQRLFDEYVGVGPKWVIQRYRLHEAAEQIAAAHERCWADFALELGYADQAHFIRDFKKLVGRSPGDYFRSTRSTVA